MNLPEIEDATSSLSRRKLRPLGRGGIHSLYSTVNATLLTEMTDRSASALFPLFIG